MIIPVEPFETEISEEFEDDHVRDYIPYDDPFDDI